MTKNKIAVEFSGFEELAEKLEELGGDLKDVAEKALVESKKLVTKDIHTAMDPHRHTGKTESSIRDESKVEWEGTVGSIEVGFDLDKGGLPSIFLMYGTPRMKKDTKLYNSIYGAATKKRIAQIQQEIFQKATERKMR